MENGVFSVKKDCEPDIFDTLGVVMNKLISSLVLIKNLGYLAILMLFTMCAILSSDVVRFAKVLY